MVLRSKTKKLILVLVGLIFLNGCEASYTIIIDKNNINEKIEVLDNVSATRSVTDIMENYKKKYPVYDDDKIPEYDDFSIKYDNVEYYNQTYNIDENGYHLYYEYNYPVIKANTSDVDVYHTYVFGEDAYAVLDLESAGIEMKRMGFEPKMGDNLGQIASLGWLTMGFGAKVLDPVACTIISHAVSNPLPRVDSDIYASQD